MPSTSIDQAIERIQFAYPQIYHACHTRHERRRSTADHLSMRDSAILVHLDRDRPLTLGALAAHLGLAASTLSEAISRLEAHGFVQKTPEQDRRRMALRLTAKAVRTVRATSVLESSRLKAILLRLTTEERRRVTDGLALLADGCRRGARPRAESRR